MLLYNVQEQELPTCEHFCFFVDFPEKCSNCYSQSRKPRRLYLFAKGLASNSRACGPSVLPFWDPCQPLRGGSWMESQPRGTLSVTAGDYTSHSNSFAHRAEGPKGEDLCGAFTGWGYGSSTTTSWSPGYYQSALPSFWEEG